MAKQPQSPAGYVAFLDAVQERLGPIDILRHFVARLVGTDQLLMGFDAAARAGYESRVSAAAQP